MSIGDVGAHFGEEVQGTEYSEICLVPRVDRVCPADDLGRARLPEQPLRRDGGPDHTPRDDPRRGRIRRDRPAYGHAESRVGPRQEVPDASPQSPPPPEARVTPCAGTPAPSFPGPQYPPSGGRTIPAQQRERRRDGEPADPRLLLRATRGSARAAAAENARPASAARASCTASCRPRRGRPSPSTRCRTRRRRSPTTAGS